MFPVFKRFAFKLADEKPKKAEALSLKESFWHIDRGHTQCGVVDFWVYLQ
jgi:hypothetical protein